MKGNLVLYFVAAIAIVAIISLVGIIYMFFG